MNYRLLAKYLGYLSAALGLLMVPSIGWAVYYQEPQALWGFTISIIACLLIGGTLGYAGRRAESLMTHREALSLVGITWFLMALLGALPYIFARELGFVDAFFESMSGFTTTGSTVIEDIEATAKSVLFWRSFTQWLGGLGIVVLFIAVLPYLGAGGKLLFRSETTGPTKRGLQPRIRDTANYLYRLYIGLTVLQLLLLIVAGMEPYDAACTTFSTLSTGGFSPQQESIAAYESPLIEWIIIFFMAAGGVNFVLYFAFLRGTWGTMFRDTEFRAYALIMVAATLLITANLAGLRSSADYIREEAQTGGFEGAHYEGIEELVFPLGESFRLAAFQAVSVMTTTGFATSDFDVWPHFSRMLLVVLMLIGGCGGSTAGGFKVARAVILLKMAYWRLERTFRPKTVHVVRLSDQVIDEDVQSRISGFLVLYLLWFLVGTLIMSAYGLPFATATTAVITTLNNVGPGLELVGANMDFAFIPAPGKLFLALCMVVGRLEIFTICVLFMPSFWRSRWTH
ncbi:MAG: TrkH family potassium uptake protein [Candidatus Hydrogenedentales bacterium]